MSECPGFFSTVGRSKVLTSRDSRDKQEDETTAQQWTSNERSPRHHLDQEPRQHVGRHLGQSREQAIQIRVSVHVRSAQTQAEVADGDGEPEKNKKNNIHYEQVQL